MADELFALLYLLYPMMTPATMQTANTIAMRSDVTSVTVALVSLRTGSPVPRVKVLQGGK